MTLIKQIDITYRTNAAALLTLQVPAYEKGITKVIVATGSQNIPALNFYQKNGFQKSGEFKTAEGLSITAFEKRL
jgi:ribosomal protein S18 acetylase RimI-like enzyme